MPLALRTGQNAAHPSPGRCITRSARVLTPPRRTPITTRRARRTPPATPLPHARVRRRPPAAPNPRHPGGRAVGKRESTNSPDASQAGVGSVDRDGWTGAARLHGGSAWWPLSTADRHNRACAHTPGAAARGHAGRRAGTHEPAAAAGARHRADNSRLPGAAFDRIGAGGGGAAGRVRGNRRRRAASVAWGRRRRGDGRGAAHVRRKPGHNPPRQHGGASSNPRGAPAGGRTHAPHPAPALAWRARKGGAHALQLTDAARAPARRSSSSGVFTRKKIRAGSRTPRKHRTCTTSNRGRCG